MHKILFLVTALFIIISSFEVVAKQTQSLSEIYEDDEVRSIRVGPDTPSASSSEASSDQSVQGLKCAGTPCPNPYWYVEPNHHRPHDALRPHRPHLGPKHPLKDDHIKSHEDLKKPYKDLDHQEDGKHHPRYIAR